MATAHTTIALAAWWFLFFTPRCLAITFEPSLDCFAAVRARGVHRTLTTAHLQAAEATQPVATPQPLPEGFWSRFCNHLHPPDYRGGLDHALGSGSSWLGFIAAPGCATPCANAAPHQRRQSRTSSRHPSNFLQAVRCAQAPIAPGAVIHPKTRPRQSTVPSDEFEPKMPGPALVVAAITAFFVAVVFIIAAALTATVLVECMVLLEFMVQAAMRSVLECSLGIPLPFLN